MSLSLHHRSTNVTICCLELTSQAVCPCPVQHLLYCFSNMNEHTYLVFTMTMYNVRGMGDLFVILPVCVCGVCTLSIPTPKYNSLFSLLVIMFSPAVFYSEDST